MPLATSKNFLLLRYLKSYIYNSVAEFRMKKIKFIKKLYFVLFCFAHAYISPGQKILCYIYIEAR